MNDIYINGETTRQITKNSLESDASISSHLSVDLIDTNNNITNNVNKNASFMLKENNELKVSKKQVTPKSEEQESNKSNSSRITNDLTNFNNYTSETESIQNKTLDEIMDNEIESNDLENDDLAIDSQLGYSNNHYLQSGESLDKFFDQILADNDDSFKSTSNNDSSDLLSNRFFCINCRLKFETSEDFLRHCNEEVDSCHTNFRVNKDQEKFLINNLVILKKQSNVRVDCKIIVFLIESEMKKKFLEKYSHDLLVANEETAICLEDLNNDKRSSGFKSKNSNDRLINNENDSVKNDDEYVDFESENEFAEYDDLNDKQKQNEISTNEFALLFVEYSIIQFSRILEKLKNLYNLNESESDFRHTSDSETSNNDEPAVNMTNTDKHNLVSDESSATSDEDESNELKHQPFTKKFNENENLFKIENNLDILKRSKSLFADLTKQQESQIKKQEAKKTMQPNKVSTMHSRNACKKLKCPKCNWHYKYRETLDIHMREKHSTDLSKDLSQKCIYCLENTQHPRLGRGEQYKCGYKPYRCDICDYSTTTKGNLSIHMQSDKHINNLKELKTNPKSDKTQLEQTDNNINMNANESVHLTTDSKSTPNLSESEQNEIDSNQFKSNICNSFATDNKKSLRAQKQMMHSTGNNLVNSHNGAVANGSALKMNAKTIKLEYGANSDSIANKKSNHHGASIDKLNNESSMSVILCPLCQIEFSDQNFLQAHLKESHSVINEDALKILVNSAQSISKKNQIMTNDANNIKTENTKNSKQENVFPPLSIDQSKLIEFSNNNRFNHQNANNKLLLNHVHQNSSASIKMNSKIVAEHQQQSEQKILNSSSRSRSSSSTDDSADHNNLNAENLIQIQIDHFIELKSQQSNRVYRKLITQICQQFTDLNHRNFNSTDAEAETEYLIRCYLCKKSTSTFKNLSELKSHLEAEHETSLNLTEINKLIYKYVKDILSEYSQNLSEELINKSVQNFSKSNGLKIVDKNNKLPFSAESLLSSSKKSSSGEDPNGIQNAALLNYLSAFGKNAQNGGSAPNSALINQFLLPLIMSQNSQKNTNPSMNESPCKSPMHPTPTNEDDDEDVISQQYQSNQNSDPNNSRRRRTRITEEQLKVLRQYFDINKSPSDEQITDIAQRTQLQAKVIKHWFRNTLFKERQKDKDSPYNFNNPPVTQLNLEEYEKTGKICTSNNEQQNHSQKLGSERQSLGMADIKNELLYESVVKAAAAAVEAAQVSESTNNSFMDAHKQQKTTEYKSETSDGAIQSNALEKPVSLSSQSTLSSTSSASSINENDEDLYESMSGRNIDENGSIKQNISEKNESVNNQHLRPNRTKFSNYQIKALNQLFKQQRYPKDEQIAKLGKQLHLKQRVITVWFQNARQKARKSNSTNGSGQYSGSNKSLSPSNSSQEYDENEYEDLDDNYDEDNEDNNYYDADYDDNQSHVSSDSMRYNDKLDKPIDKNKTENSQLNANGSSKKDEGLVAQNAKALQLAMSFIAAHQAGGSNMPKDQSFAALAAAFNQSVLNNNNINNNNATQSENGENTKTQDDDDEEDNTTGYDDNELSDDDENDNEEYTSSVNYQGGHNLSSSSSLQYQASSLIGSAVSTNCSSNAKRLRTTILPEQQEYLMQKYQLDQNPSRKMLDEIAKEVRLKKRVVQVWFQNTRARERKGIIKINNNPVSSTNSLMLSSSSSSTSSSTNQSSTTQSSTNSSSHKSSSNQFCKRCLFCVSNPVAFNANVFMNRSSLESHLILKHNYTYEQTSLIDIDQFPDVNDNTSAEKSSVSKQRNTNSNTSPSLSPAPLHPPLPPPATNNLQNFYSNLLLQQQQQQQHAQFNSNALLHSALIQGNANSATQQGQNGISTLLMSQLFNQLQQQKANKTDESPLDLSQLNGSNGLNALSSIALAAAAAYKTPNFQQKVDNRSRSNSSTNGDNFTTKPANKLGSSYSPNAIKNQQTQQQVRRVRTQMTQYQVNVMRLIFAEYKTPTMNECEQMGREINLKKRVVQVWFQNARAKEKKSNPLSTKSILFSNTANNDLSNYEFSPDECLLCGFKYANSNLTNVGSNSQAQRDHLFSKGHINKLIQFVTNVAVENGADMNTGKFFTGFYGSSSTGSEFKRKRDLDDDDDNESSDGEASNAENEENIIEYGDSEEQVSDNEDSYEYDKAKNTKYSHKNQIKNSNDSSFSSNHSSTAPSNNSNLERCYNDENDENSSSQNLLKKPTAQINSANLAQTSLNSSNPFDLDRLIQANSSRATGKNSTDFNNNTNNNAMQNQQQQQLYNYLLYSNLLNNSKM